MQCEDKEVIYKDQLPSCVDECHGVVCNYNHQHISNYIVTATTPNDKIRDDWWVSNLNILVKTM